MTSVTSSNSDAPARVKVGTAWICIYVLVVGALIGVAFLMPEWWQRAAMVLVAVFTVLRILKTEREEVTSVVGKCRYCAAKLTESDRECPGCERPVPKEQRLKMRHG